LMFFAKYYETYLYIYLQREIVIRNIRGFLRISMRPLRAL